MFSFSIERVGVSESHNNNEHYLSCNLNDTHFCGLTTKQLAEVVKDFISFLKDFALVKIFCKMSALYRICTSPFISKCLC